MFTYRRNLTFSGSDPVAFEPLITVIGSLLAETGITPDQFMVVGAEARNLLHQSFNLHAGDLSTTHDVDVALEVPDDGHLINVLGYTDAFAAADTFVLPTIGRLKVVAPWHYVILKLEALADRSQNFNYKDAQDIGTALYWLETSEGDAAWIYEKELDALIANNLAVDVTLAQTLGQHLGGLLDAQQHKRLMDKVERLDSRDFSGELRRGLFRTNTSVKNDAARERYEALVRGLASRSD